MVRKVAHSPVSRKEIVRTVGIRESEASAAQCRSTHYKLVVPRFSTVVPLLTSCVTAGSIRSVARSFVGLPTKLRAYGSQKACNQLRGGDVRRKEDNPLFGDGIGSGAEILAS